MSQVEYIKTLLKNGNWTDNEKKFLENSIKDAEIMDSLSKNKIKRIFTKLIDKLF